MHHCPKGETMGQMYCYCVNFREELSTTERASISVTSDGFSTECGLTFVDFGYDERYLLVYAVAESPEAAHEKLTTLLNAQGWEPVPFPIDWTKAQALVSALYPALHAQHLTTAEFVDASEIDFGNIKNEINRKIAQNLKWNRKFEQLMEKIDQYQRRPNRDLFVRIMDQCAELHVLPEYKSSGA